MLPLGVLKVKGYDVTGSIISFGEPISGVYVLLYSKEENPKFRVEGCNTALLQGVPDSPICHSVTDASGEFRFGLVPAGEYKLLVLPTSPGQIAVTYNIKPESVPFVVKHNSLYIKNAFEVSGFTLIGTAVGSVGGKGLSGARVLLDGKAIGNTDAAGKFTLGNLKPAVYTVGLQHDQCEFEDIQLTVTPNGPSSTVILKASRWRVCGSVTPPVKTLRITPDHGSAEVLSITPEETGNWCTYLHPGVYTAKVEVTEQEQRDGLQFFPLSQQISVGSAAVEGVRFSQLKGTVRGRIECRQQDECRSVPVTLRARAADGAHLGDPVTTLAVDGEYTFTDVVAGSVELSVGGSRLCWQEERLVLPLLRDTTRAPPFRHLGYVLRLHSSHDIQVEYESAASSGVLQVPRGASQACVEGAARYQLTPRGPHLFQPPRAHADTTAQLPPTIHFVAVAHAATLRVTSPLSVDDLVLNIDTDESGEEQQVGPLTPQEQPTGGYSYEHTIYLAEGSEAQVSAYSSRLLFSPPRGRAGAGGALLLRGRPALTVAGTTQPPLPGVTVTLSAEDMSLTQVTAEDGTYSFGPLDSSKSYSVTAEKESYVFAAPDADGVIRAHKLAEIVVELVDDADDTPLQEALVSVSGGAYRRTQSGAALTFGSLAPAQYYVRPHLKEYRFAPPHRLVLVRDGAAHRVQLRGVRTAWSCCGRARDVSGRGWAGAGVRAVPHHERCPSAHAEHATTDDDGSFRIRGLLPGCTYTIELQESDAPELAGLKIVRAPATIEVTDNKDILGVELVAVRPQRTTDGAVLVRAALPHYRTLVLSLAASAATAASAAPARIYSVKLDPAGYTEASNPGLVYALPRLPADNRSYVLTLESTLPRATHAYGDHVYHFNSDGNYKHFTIDFVPKVRASEQELRASSMLALPLLALLAALYAARARLLDVAARAMRRHPTPTKQHKKKL